MRVELNWLRERGNSRHSYNFIALIWMHISQSRQEVCVVSVNLFNYREYPSVDMCWNPVMARLCRAQCSILWCGAFKHFGIEEGLVDVVGSIL